MLEKTRRKLVNDGDPLGISIESLKKFTCERGQQGIRNVANQKHLTEDIMIKVDDIVLAWG